ncbi:uncharacterized protein [Rutidosis leptorrhynchoides]|uniref:uncharacterized protein n=1 Tax=Rutidosis leptorrhynchoides TaxID=125765 RepID=UPI003A9A5836
MGCDYDMRNLGKSQLGGVIFGTTKMTINECFSKQLFGLPKSHILYVRKIEPGLPLFLFNYTDRTLHGIFEAVSSGQENIDPYAWTCAGSQKTPYPAQVQIREKLRCKPLTEDQFKPIISDNYHTMNHFWFELDHAQSNRLLSLLATQAISGGRTPHAPHSTIKPKTLLPFERERVSNIPQVVVGHHLNGAKISPNSMKDVKPFNTVSNKEVVGNHLNGAKSLPNMMKDVKPFNKVSDKDLISMKLKTLASNRKPASPSPAPDKLMGPPSANRKDESVVLNVSPMEKKEVSPDKSCEDNTVIAQLIQKVEDLMASTVVQNDTINQLKQKIVSLENNLAEANTEINYLKSTRNTLEVPISVGPQEFEDIKEREIIEDGLPDDSIVLIGGYDGASWLSSVDCYSPSRILTKSLNPMNTERCYAAVSKLDGELFVFGGGTRGQWFDTVESYNPAANRWTTCPPLNKKNGSLAGATVNDKIYAVGGGNGEECFSAVEMLDFDVGAWIQTRSMREKRFALAAAELNGALYAVGGYDGNGYLRTAERFDPREHSWKKIASMNTMRGCPSMVVLNEKLFVIGGYDGYDMVSTVEIYDPRRGSWVIGEPMNLTRGFSAAAVAKDCIYIFGGLKSGEEINDTVECYKEGRGWEIINTNGPYRRCFSSAIAL